jgi:hypothetical protein
VGAIHRTVSGLAEGTDLAAALEGSFEVSAAGPPNEALAARLAADGALVLFTPAGVWRLVPRAAANGADGSELDSALVARALASLGPAEVDHRHSWADATGPVVTGQAQAALLLRPVTAAQIAGWAGERRRMPPKTTYFWPKPRTGMVLRTLS